MGSPSRSSGRRATDSSRAVRGAITRRKYTAPLLREGERALFARLGPPGRDWYFVLGTEQEGLAAAKAERISRVIDELGIDAACARHPREFTLSIYWSDRPCSCTYSTFVTFPTRPLPSSAVSHARNRKPTRVALVEPDATLREAISHWLDQLPGCSSAWSLPGPIEDVHRHPLSQADVLLHNRFATDLSAPELRQRFSRIAPGLAVFPFSVHPTSDDIFASVSGVDEGYFLRRRPPGALLEPLDGAFDAGRPTADSLRDHLRRYFQELFQKSAGRGGGEFPQLTPREHQILGCLQKGLHDKEIAAILSISPLTVHTHLKHIFEKLSAHTRTEAVMKYLQK
jgi:DNA-binding NarL/FixJ family response regulator